MTSARLDTTKETVLLKGLDKYANALTKYITQVQRVPANATRIAHLTTECVLTWDLEFPPEDRINIQYTNGLRSIAEYNSGEPIHMPLAVAFAVLEQLRSATGYTKVFFLGYPNSVIYMSKEPPKLYLIGISGKIGSGKSTASEYLTEYHGYEEYAFALPLKEVAVCLGFEESEVYGTQEDKMKENSFWGVSGRKFMQVFGSEICRDYLPKVLPEMKLNGLTIWARLFEHYLEKTKSESDQRVVISDVRFKDESDVIKKNGGIVIKLIRPDEKSDEHQSETSIDKVEQDITLHNNGTQEELFEKLAEIIDMVGNDFATNRPLNLVLYAKAVNESQPE